MTDLAYRGDVVPLRQPAQELSEFGAAMLAGLDRATKWISAKYFYDTAGSLLFDQICELPEYYPTRTEMGLLQNHAHEFAKLIGPDATLIEFGAGSSRKVGLLLDALERPRAYEPVDISGDYLHDVANKLRETRPALTVHPIVADFTKPFALPGGDAPRIDDREFRPRLCTGFLAPRSAHVEGRRVSYWRRSGQRPGASSCRL